MSSFAISFLRRNSVAPESAFGGGSGPAPRQDFACGGEADNGRFREGGQRYYYQYGEGVYAELQVPVGSLSKIP